MQILYILLKLLAGIGELFNLLLQIIHTINIQSYSFGKYFLEGKPSLRQIAPQGLQTGAAGIQSIKSRR